MGAAQFGSRILPLPVPSLGTGFLDMRAFADPAPSYNSTMSVNLLRNFDAGLAQIEVYASPEAQGKAAAQRAARLITEAIEERGRARIIAATGNSQIPLVEALAAERIEWPKVELFHMDEYIGIPANHPSSFRYWIKTRLADKVHPHVTHYLEGDAADIDREIERYSPAAAQGTDRPCLRRHRRERTHRLQ